MPIVRAGPGAHRPRRRRRPGRRGVLLAVKDTQNDEAARWLARLCDEHTVVCALQNGVEQVDRVGPLLPVVDGRARLVWFSAETAARRLGPAAHASRGWCCPTARRRDARRAAARRRRARSSCDPDFVTAAWRKLLVNARGRVDGADRPALGHVPPRRRRRAGPPLSRRMPGGGPGRGRRPGRRRHRRDRRHVRRGARGHGHVDADRPRSTAGRWSGTSATA